MTAPTVLSFFDKDTKSYSYVVADERAGICAVIDSVLDFDIKSGRTSTEGADALVAAVKERGWRTAWVLETHAHADHLSAASLIRERSGAKIGIGIGIQVVQEAFGPVFGVHDLQTDDFDQLFEDGDSISLGELTIEVLATPGHTPACLTYRIKDAAFVGDTLFMPDYGTARCDFPGGDARQLFRSLHRILALPRDTRLFMCHDYKAQGRDVFAWQTTVGEQLDRNAHVGGGVGEDAYVAMREARDATLKPPKLLYPAIQVNIRGGRLPPPDEQGRRYLVLPLSV